MINILFNSNHPELVFAIAAFMANLDKEHSEEVCDFIPIKTSDLSKSMSEIKAKLDKEIEIVWGESYFDESENNNEAIKYVLFGIFPANESEDGIIASFFYDNKEQIMLWVDWHLWPKGLLSFIHTSDRVLINKIKTCLELMMENGYEFPEIWLQAERAMITHDMTNDWAARYLRAFLVARAAGQNYFTENGSDFVIFFTFVSEILDDRENEELSKVEDEFMDMVQETDIMAESFTDDHPIFLEAKKIGRPVGCLLLDEVADYFNTDEILLEGLKKYPWLCVLRYKINDTIYLFFDSEKLNLKDLIETYQKYTKQEEEFFKILSAEVLRYKDNDS